MDSCFYVYVAVASFIFLLILQRLYYKRMIHLAKLEEVFKTEKRISRKIHDELANDVFIAMMKAQSKKPHSEDLLQSLEGVYTKAREISHDFGPIPEQLSLLELLKTLLASYNTDGLKIVISTSKLNSSRKYKPYTKRTIYRVFQELFTNIKKHSQASKVLVELIENNKKLNILIEDNGIGFDVLSNTNKGMGLKNVENRIHSIGGEINFDSSKSNGTTVLIEIPLK